MSLRLRLILLAIIAAVPAIVLLRLNQLDITEARFRELEQQVLTLAKQQAAEVDRIAEGALQFLVALAQIPEIQSGGRGCEQLLSHIRPNYPGYRALIRADRDGSISCSSIGPGPSIADRLYFRRALERNDFAVGEYVHGRGTRAPGIHFAYPIRGEDGGVVGIIAAALDVDWFASRLGEKLPPDLVLTVADSNGTIVVRLPGNETFRGQQIPEHFHRIIYATVPGVTQAVGLDGVRNVLGYVPIPASPNGIYVGVGRSLDAAFADLNRLRIRGWAGVALGLTASLLLAWFWSEHGIRRPLRELLAIAGDLRRGEYIQSGKKWDSSELGEIGRAFDDLAGAVSDREARLRRSELMLQQREIYLSNVLDRIPAGIMQTRPDTTYAFVNRTMCEIVGRSRDELLGLSFAEITHPDDVADDTERFKQALHKREPYTHRKRYLRPDGSTVWTENTVSHLEEGQGVLAICVELRERMEAEERQRRLMDELNHRVKNTLATVQALMAMSRRYTGSIEQFIQTFSARLQALSITHNLLTDGLWEAVPLKELVAAELQPYGAGRTDVQGSAVQVGPREAILLGMIFHELATNAGKYGAFSVDDGAVSVRWNYSATTREQRLDIEWRETGAPPAADPERRGFGTRLIRESMQDLEGTADLRFEASGLVWTFSMDPSGWRGFHPGVPANRTVQ